MRMVQIDWIANQLAGTLGRAHIDPYPLSLGTEFECRSLVVLLDLGIAGRLLRSVSDQLQVRAFDMHDVYRNPDAAIRRNRKRISHSSGPAAGTCGILEQPIP